MKIDRKVKKGLVKLVQRVAAGVGETTQLGKAASILECVPEIDRLLSKLKEVESKLNPKALSELVEASRRIEKIVDAMIAVSADDPVPSPTHAEHLPQTGEERS